MTLVPRMPSLDGRIFVPIAGTGEGDVDGSTRFEYHERPDGTVFAHYRGGTVDVGFLVGTRQGDTLEFRYAHLAAGETATGFCRTEITVLDDGRIRLDEEWRWESRAGTGTSTLVEEQGTPTPTACSDAHPLHVR